MSHPHPKRPREHKGIGPHNPEPPQPSSSLSSLFERNHLSQNLDRRHHLPAEQQPLPTSLSQSWSHVRPPGPLASHPSHHHSVIASQHSHHHRNQHLTFTRYALPPESSPVTPPRFASSQKVLDPTAYSVANAVSLLSRVFVATGALRERHLNTEGIRIQQFLQTVECLCGATRQAREEVTVYAWGLYRLTKQKYIQKGGSQGPGEVPAREVAPHPWDTPGTQTEEMDLFGDNRMA